MRTLAVLLAAAAVPATLAGVLFDVIHGGTTLTRSVAYAFWFAAALCLALMAAGRTKLVWRRLDLPEAWVFIAASVVLTGAGAAIDAFGG
ncbi:MAG: hypothetical protein ABSB24_13400 [Gaiellaceae bacterium]|jgi:hypothetical protein